jgi:hypothetical protein
MKMQDYSGTPEYQEGYTTKAWQNAKRAVLWKRDTRTCGQ